MAVTQPRRKKRRRKPPDREVIVTGSERAIGIIDAFIRDQARLRDRGLDEAEAALLKRQWPVKRTLS